MLSPVLKRGIQGWQQALADQGAFARAAHAGDQHQAIQWKTHRDILQIVRVRVPQDQLAPVAGSDLASGSPARIRMGRAQATAGNGIRVTQEFVEGTCRHHLAAVAAGAGPEVDHIIGATHCFLVVFDDENRVAPGFQFLERGEQLFIIPRVQADGGFVQDVEDSAKIRTKLSRQPDALAFTAREGGHAAAQLQIAQPDLFEKFQPLPDFRQDIPRNDGFASGGFEFAEPEVRGGDRHGGEIGQAEAGLGFRS